MDLALFGGGAFLPEIQFENCPGSVVCTRDEKTNYVQSQTGPCQSASCSYLAPVLREKLYVRSIFQRDDATQPPGRSRKPRTSSGVKNTSDYPGRVASTYKFLTTPRKEQ